MTADTATDTLQEQQVGIIDQKRAEHAQQIGVEESRVRTYALDLQWMLEHGTLVDVDVHGSTLFNTRASLNELGIPSGDTRAARLRPGIRELIDAHTTAHAVLIVPPVVYMGFSPDMPAPPSFYFAKASTITKVAYLDGNRWITIEGPWGEGSEEAASGKWIALQAILTGDTEPTSDNEDGEAETAGPATSGSEQSEVWQPAEFQDQRMRWLRITTSADKIEAGDLVCNPIKSFRSLEVRFRGSLDKFGNVFEGFGNYRWIGFKAYHAWKQEWDRMQVEWQAVKAYTLWRYDEFVQALESDFAAIAAEAWQAMSARHPQGFAVLVDDAPVDNQGAFTHAIVDKAVSRMPSRERIERELYVDYRPALLLGQETVAADMAAAAQHRTVVEEEHAKQHVIQEEAYAQKRIVWEAERAEQRVIAERERTEREREQTEQRKLQAMRQAELEKARRIMANTVSPYEEMFSRLRAEMNAAAAQILESLKKNESLRGKTADKARNMIELFRLMNSHDDQDLEALVGQLEARLPSAGGTGKEHTGRNQAIEEALSEVIGFTQQAAYEVSHRAGAQYGFEALEL